MTTIQKIGAIIIEDRQLLVGKKRDTFIIPGGRREKGESDEECLRRELQEEFCLELVDMKLFGSYEDEAALDPGMRVHINLYEVTANGKPISSNEIIEARFINSTTTLKLGSIIRKFILPKLKAAGKID